MPFCHFAYNAEMCPSYRGMESKHILFEPFFLGINFKIKCSVRFLYFVCSFLCFLPFFEKKLKTEICILCFTVIDTYLIYHIMAGENTPPPEKRALLSAVHHLNDRRPAQ